MANKEEMLKVIYEKIARKDLTMGCKISILCSTDEDGGYGYSSFILARYGAEAINKDPCNMKNVYYNYKNEKFYPDKYTKIIGHPVMIGDVLDWVSKSGKQGFQYDRPGGTPSIHLYEPMITNLWKEKREPIEKQSDELIEYVYKLCV